MLSVSREVAGPAGTARPTRALQGPVQRSLLARRLRRALSAASAGGRLRPSSSGRKVGPRGGRIVLALRGDYDADGEDEAIIRGNAFAGIVKPHGGGGWAEIDHYGLGRNLCDVLGRRREAYHTERASGPSAKGGSIHERAKPLPGGARNLFRYDDHERLSGLERFYDAGAEIVDIDAVAGMDRARFVGARYAFQSQGSR